MSKPRIITRDQHTISRRDISQLALNILYRLRDAGFDAYLVGGSVRDLLLGLHPKDFDIATNAHPEQIRKLFTNSRLIGRRFRIVHVFSGRQIVEVTTFRKGGMQEADDHALNEHGIVLRDNTFGTIEEDALRRDFTVNALYYNIADFSVVDYVHGLADLKKQTMRLIGEPEVRFREDPVRMLRAIRLAGKLDFKLDKAIIKALPEMKDLLKHISSSRLFDEFLKILMSGKSTAIFESLLKHDLLSQLLPSILPVWDKIPEAEAFVKQALINTDERLAQGKSINPAFMLAVLYWHSMNKKLQELEASGMSKAVAFEHATSKTINIALKDLSIPRRFTTIMREIWFLQRRFHSYANKRLLLIPEQPRFRAGYDFLLLRAEIDPNLKTLADWWTTFYEAAPEKRIALLATKPSETKEKKKKSHKRSNKKPNKKT